MKHTMEANMNIVQLYFNMSEGHINEAYYNKLIQLMNLQHLTLRCDIITVIDLLVQPWLFPLLESCHFWTARKRHTRRSDMELDSDKLRIVECFIEPHAKLTNFSVEFYISSHTADAVSRKANAGWSTSDGVLVWTKPSD
jgi:hypothetical protein